MEVEDDISKTGGAETGLESPLLSLSLLSSVLLSQSSLVSPLTRRPQHYLQSALDTFSAGQFGFDLLTELSNNRMSHYSAGYPSLGLPATTHRRRSLPKLPNLNGMEGCYHYFLQTISKISM